MTSSKTPALLKADHEEVSQLFAEVEKIRSVPNQKALKDRLLVPEATVEHAGTKGLIAQLEGAEPDGERHDAKVKVLSECVKHHVKEEQTEMFPKARASSLDLVELGARLAARKQELLSAARPS